MAAISRPFEDSHGDAPSRDAVITLIQGEHRVVAHKDVVLNTLLGSCVAACLWDEAAQAGGMNHFLLPPREERPDGSLAFGEATHAMELLINDLLKRGASRARLQAKLFGGARMVRGLSDIGAKNAEFAVRFLEREGIPLVLSSLGGERGRRVQFWPMNGRARMIFMKSEEVVPETVRNVRPEPSGDLELF